MFFFFYVYYTQFLFQFWFLSNKLYSLIFYCLCTTVCVCVCFRIYDFKFGNILCKQKPTYIYQTVHTYLTHTRISYVTCTVHNSTPSPRSHFYPYPAHPLFYFKYYSPVYNIRGTQQILPHLSVINRPGYIGKKNCLLIECVRNFYYFFYLGKIFTLEKKKLYLFSHTFFHSWLILSTIFMLLAFFPCVCVTNKFITPHSQTPLSTHTIILFCYVLWLYVFVMKLGRRLGVLGKFVITLFWMQMYVWENVQWGVDGWLFSHENTYITSVCVYCVWLPAIKHTKQTFFGLWRTDLVFFSIFFLLLFHFTYSGTFFFCFCIFLSMEIILFTFFCLVFFL